MKVQHYYKFFLSFLKSHYYYFYIIIFSMYALFFVFFRMKQVDFDYNYFALNKKIEKQYIKEKTLKAKKASLLSIGNLHRLAKEFSFDRPKEEQIIIIK